MNLSLDGVSLPLALPATSDPPPLRAMVPIVESQAGGAAARAEYQASAALSGAQAVAAAGAYNGVIQAINAAVQAICAPLAAGGDATAAQIMAVSIEMTVKAAVHQAEVTATAAELG